MESSTSASQIHVFPQFRNARSTLPCAVNISGINFKLEIDLLVKFAYTCVDNIIEEYSLHTKWYGNHDSWVKCATSAEGSETGISAVLTVKSSLGILFD